MSNDDKGPPPDMLLHIDHEGPSVTIELSIDREAAQGVNHSFPAAVFWGWYDIILSYGLDQALELASYSAAFVQSGLTEEWGGATRRAPLPDDERAYLRSMLKKIKDIGDHEENKEEFALSMSYAFLNQPKEKEWRWSRKQAARFASNILGYDIKPDTWRKRLDKYIRENDLPKIELPRGKATTRKIDDDIPT